MPQMRVFIAEFIPLAATLRVSPYVNSRRQLDVVWVVFGPFDLLSLASACRLSAVDRVPPADQLTTESPGLPHWWLPAVAARFFCLILQSRPISNRINRSATLDACHIGCLSHWLPVTLDACHIGCLSHWMPASCYCTCVVLPHSTTLCRYSGVQLLGDSQAACKVSWDVYAGLDMAIKTDPIQFKYVTPPAPHCAPRQPLPATLALLAFSR